MDYAVLRHSQQRQGNDLHVHMYMYVVELMCLEKWCNMFKNMYMYIVYMYM